MGQNKFKCPICGSKEYEEKIESNGILGPGGSSWVKYYTCYGCSVMFKDVNKFTKKIEKQK
ncbi:hypothetical protein KKH14_00650 [Patescibacteria group bacterium]|nr:hypothetical protein [Patescibacteria group bacterium]